MHLDNDRLVNSLWLIDAMQHVDNHWFRQWLGTKSSPKLFLTFSSNKFNLKSAKIAAILFRPRCATFFPPILCEYSPASLTVISTHALGACCLAAIALISPGEVVVAAVPGEGKITLVPITQNVQQQQWTQQCKSYTGLTTKQNGVISLALSHWYGLRLTCHCSASCHLTCFNEPWQSSMYMVY